MQGLMGDPSQGFQPIADQAMSRFRSEIVPSLAERFTGLGTGARRSSAYTGALGQAGAGLASDLASQQAQYGSQRMSGLAQLLGLGMQPQFENVHRTESPGALQMMGGPLLKAGLGGLGGAAEMYSSREAQEGQSGADTARRDEAEKQRVWQERMYNLYPNSRRF